MRHPTGSNSASDAPSSARVADCRWPLHQHAHQCHGGAQVAQGMERQRLHAGSQRAWHSGQGIGQRAPCLHGLHAFGHLHQLLRQADAPISN
jgi:hypothetical protein